MSNLDVTKKTILKTQSHEQNYKNSVRDSQLLNCNLSHIIHTFSELLIYLSCFIFCYKAIEYQSFRKMKHTTYMFHF